MSVLVLGVVAAIWREPLPRRRDLLGIAAFGVLWLGVYSFTLNAAERRVDAGTAAMLINTGPILLGWVVLGETPPWLAAVGGVLCVGGVAVARR